MLHPFSPKETKKQKWHSNTIATEKVNATPKRVLCQFTGAQFFPSREPNFLRKIIPCTNQLKNCYRITKKDFYSPPPPSKLTF